MIIRVAPELNPKETLIQLINQLPENRVAEVLDFALFINTRQTAGTSYDQGILYGQKHCRIGDGSGCRAFETRADSAFLAGRRIH
jgi:hypothetical protein